MARVELRTGPGLAYREARGEGSAGPVLLLHGYPESSLMWEPLMAELADAGHDCFAPDLFGLGDSTGEGAFTFEGSLEALTAFMDERDLPPVALIVHDWGGFVGLAWACEHPDRVASLVISDTGFFSDGKWHGMAEAVRSEQGEALVAAMDRDGFTGLLRGAIDDKDIAAYWQPFEEGRGQRATLGFFRSMDFEKLAPWDRKLGEIGLPTLLLWGADDQFAWIGGAHRFEREIPGARLVALEGVGHFVFDEARERANAEVLAFLRDQ